MSPATRKRPQLTLDELQQVKWLLGGVLTLIGLSTVFYMDVEAWTVSGLTALATVATMLRPKLPARVPSLVHTLAFPAIVMFFLADLWLMTEVLPAMVRLDILLLLYRNVSYRQRRDDLQIIVLGLFLVIVAGVLTVSLTFAVQILIYTGGALALLLVVTLCDAVLGVAHRAPVPFGETPAWAHHMNVRQVLRRLREVLDWRVVGLGIVLFVGVVGVSALLFLAIPRFQLESGMFLDRLISKKARSGFSDTVRFGDVTEILQDTSVALSVDVSDHSEVPASPYWRMLVLDHYENGAFRFSQLAQSMELARQRTSLVLNGTPRSRRREPVQWTFFLESGVSRYLPLLGQFETLRFREPQNFRYGRQAPILALREEPVTMLPYRVEGFEIAASLPDAAFARELTEHASSPQRRVLVHLRLPTFPRQTDSTVLNRVLAEVTGGEKLPAPEFSRRACEWLKRNHAYSLSPNIPGSGGDPLVRWLSSREAGHCELFAGSLVLLARAAGIPARMVTGFRGGTWNGYSNNFTIRNSDAHAWAELFDEASGNWLRADPLAAATSVQTEDMRGEAAVASRLDRSWKARLDSLRVFWYRRIVSFDQRSQVETFKAVKEATRMSGRILREVLAEKLSSLREWLATPWDLSRILKLAGSVTAAALLFWLWRDVGRDWWRALRRGGATGRADPVRREASRWLGRLSTLRASGPEAESARRELQRLRFGAQGTWPDPQQVFRRARHAWQDARRRQRITRS
jgi:transglutaminase-like putative cysteine protease